jgi:Mn2+/Fe2+ NRAMP family transporter
MSTDRIAAEKLALREARAKGGLAKAKTYLKFSGPGWLQGAITLGGGSLAGSLYLGVIGGFSFLWLQVIAMIMGVIMLSAITYVTLSTGRRPFKAINDHINPVLGWGWALATIMASIVWALPQFALGTAAVQQNLVPELTGDAGKLLICISLLVIATAIVWSYDSGYRGVKIFEWILKGMVAVIVLCFFGVVLKMAFSEEGLAFGEIFRGFIPDLSLLNRPAASFDAALAATGDYVSFWSKLIVSEQRDIMITAAATAVGINMTFLLPYSMLRKGWDRESRGLAIFDLSTGLFIPFVLATGCVVIAAASQFHTKPQPGVIERTAPAGMLRQYDGLLAKRLEMQIGVEQVSALRKQAEMGVSAEAVLAAAENGELVLPAEKAAALQSVAGYKSALRDQLEALPDADKQMAAGLVRRDAFALAGSLEGLTGRTFSHYVFGIGVLGMALSTIIILMLISGFTVCEMFGLPHQGWAHRLGCLLPALGVLGPFFWGQAQFWLAVPTSVFGMTLLPIAYLTFFLMMNNRNLMGPELLQGGKRTAANCAMLLALGLAAFGSAWSIWDKVKWTGVIIVLVFIALALIVHFARPPKKIQHAAQPAEPAVAKV